MKRQDILIPLCLCSSLNIAIQLSSCVALDELYNLSEPRFPPL